MRTALRALVPTILAFAAPIGAQKAAPEPRAGLSFQQPKGWTELPGDTDRHATVRLFAGPSALASKKEGTHTPLLRVMFFQSGGDKAADTRDGLLRTSPFRSLEDFASRGLGATNVDREPHKVGTVQGQRLTGTGIPGDLVLLGQTLPLADGEAAICVVLLENHAERLKKEIEAVFGSIEPVERVAAPRPVPPWQSDADWVKKDAATRLGAHRAFAEAAVAATTKTPEAGYKLGKSKYWTVLSGADPAFTKKTVAAAEAARDWLAKKLPELTKEAPLPAVLRVFDSVHQYNALLTTRNNSREYDQDRRELWVVNDRDLGGATGYGQTLRAVLWHLCDDVDPGVLPALPRWFDNGWWEFLRSSKFDGKKLEFFAGDVEKGRIDYYRQNSQPMTALWELMQEHIQISPTDGSMEKNWGYTPECARLMRWFLMHDGQQAFGKPTLVADYVRALGAAYWKAGPDPTGDVPAVGLTAQMMKDRNGLYYKWRDALLVGTNDLAVPLQPDVWKAINEKWLEFNKTFK